MAGIMDGFQAAQAKDLTQAGAAQPEKIGTEVFGPQGYSFREAGVTTRSVDPRTGTVQGQLDSILAKDGVYMQRTRANALAMAADMGLRNSSIAVGNAQGAMIDRAAPIAGQDAQAYNDAARDNMQAANAASLTNASNYNQLGGIMVQQRGEDRRLASAQGFQATQAQLEREQQTRIQQLQERGMDARQAQQIASQERLQREQNLFAAGENQVQRDFQSGLAAADRQLQADLQTGRITAESLQAQLNREQQERLQQLQESGTDRRQAEQIAAQERQQREQNIFAASESQANRDAQVATLIKQHELTLAQMGFQSKLNDANLPKQYAASIAQQTLDKIGLIAADGNLDAAAKKVAVQNVIDASNIAAALGSKLYGVEIPAMQLPGSTPGPASNGTYPQPYGPTTGILPADRNMAV